MAAASALVAPAAGPAAAVAVAAPMPTAFALSAGGDRSAVLLRGAPGRTLRGSTRVRNLTRKPVTVALRPADITTAANGNADYRTSGLKGSGRWLRLAATTVRLAPRQTRSVAFTVRVPARSARTSNYAGIVAINAAELSRARSGGTRKGFTFKRVNRQALPLTIRLPGALKRDLGLGPVKIDVKPAGAALTLGLRPGGNVLIDDAPIALKVTRGSRTVVAHRSALGQLFPGAGLTYRIPWEGRPTAGEYRVQGEIRPAGADTIRIDQTLKFTSKAESTMQDEAAVPGARSAALPLWAWIALTGGGVLLTGLSAAVLTLTRRSRRLEAQAG